MIRLPPFRVHRKSRLGRFAGISRCRYNRIHSERVRRISNEKRISEGLHSTVQLIRIPKETENVEEFTIAAWLKHEGEPVSRGDVILEALTDKASFQVEAEQDGILRRILAPPKSTVPVGFIVGIVAAKDEPIPDVDAENERILQQRVATLLKSGPTDERPRKGTAAPRGATRRVPATPAARRRAREAGLALDEVARSLGKTGVLTQADVEKFLQERRQ